MALSPCRRRSSLFFGCCLVMAMLVMARTGLAMQFRGSDEGNSSTTPMDSPDVAGVPDAATSMVDEEASQHGMEDAGNDTEAVVNDVEEPDNDVEDADTDSRVGEMDSNTEGSGASFVQQASKADAPDADVDDVDSLDAEADPVNAEADNDVDGGENSSGVMDDESGTMEQAGGDEDSSMAMGGEAVDQEVQPHY